MKTQKFYFFLNFFFILYLQAYFVNLYKRFIVLVYASAIVTSTSTPGSMLMDVICLTISDGECKSIIRL